MTDYTAKDYARLAHWQTQKPHAQQNPELIDALLYAKELASARGTTEACEARRRAARLGGTVVEKTRETSPIDYTEREVRERIESLEVGAWPPRNDLSIAMLTQLADMLAAAEKAEPVAWICINDSQEEEDLRRFVTMDPWDVDHFPSTPLYTHPAAQVTDGYVMVPVNDDNWPPMPVIRAMLDCQDADPEDGTESEAYYGLRAAIKEWAGMLAAQEGRG